MRAIYTCPVYTTALLSKVYCTFTQHSTRPVHHVYTVEQYTSTTLSYKSSQDMEAVNKLNSLTANIRILDLKYARCTFVHCDSSAPFVPRLLAPRM